MKIVKSPLSIRIIYWLTTFSLGVMFIMVLASFAFNILLYTDFFGNNMQLHTDLPVKVDILETGNLHLNDMDLDVKLVEGEMRIHFINTPNFISRWIGLAILIAVLLGTYLIWLFRTFLKNVNEGNIFNVNNIQLLKKLSYGIAGLWLFTIIYMRIFYYQIAKNLEFDGVLITNELPDYSGILFTAILIWILAHIFITGVRLQKETDLTI